MAYKPPLEIPEGLGFTSKVFTPNYAQQITPSGRGYVQTIDRTVPLWYAEYRTPPLRDNVYDEAIAFLGKLEQSMHTFLAFDPRRPMPRAYMSQLITSDPWTATGQLAPRVTDFDYEFSTLTLDRLLPGAVITKGDYISLFYSGVWYLFRAASNAVAPSTGIVGVEVFPRPYLPDTFTEADVRYRKACAEMKMLGNYEEEDSVEGGTTLFFRAGQFLNRSTPAYTGDPDQAWRTDAGLLIADESGNVILF